MIINGDEIILWPVLVICAYISIAIISIRHLSYECCMTHGEYHYTFLSVIGGIFWPITFIILNFSRLWED